MCNLGERYLVGASVARAIHPAKRPVCVTYRASLAALLVFLGCESLQNATAEGDTRTISFRHMHTAEELTVTYKVNGRYIDSALEKINHVLRDWREDKPIKMDPHLIDLVWDVHRELGAKEPIFVICGYRSPGTNSMLRRRSRGVAKHSQHMLGKALDFRIPGVPLEDLRAAGLRAQRGGVGFYASSNFVHLDTGSVRHWPHVPEAQMAKIMAKGPVTRVAGNDQVVAPTFKKSSPPPKATASRDEDHESETPVASIAPRLAAPAAPAARPAAPEIKVERSVTVAVVQVPPLSETTRQVASKAAPARTTKVPAAKPAPPPAPAQEPSAAPGGFALASATTQPVQLRPAQSASLVAPSSGSSNSIISERGLWHGTTESEPPQSNSGAKPAPTLARRPPNGAIAMVGGLAPWPIADRAPTGSALSYASVGTTNVPTVGNTNAPAVGNANVPATRTASAPALHPVHTAAPVQVQPDTTVAVKRSGSRPTLIASAPTPVGPVRIKPGDSFTNPWMRAVMLAPSVERSMSTGFAGEPDFSEFGVFMRKPQTSVMMTFAVDPYLGMTTERFSGYAVFFVSTVTFNQRTAALQ